jgi:hypothetical protein
MKNTAVVGQAIGILIALGTVIWNWAALTALAYHLHSEHCEVCRETYCSVCVGFHVAHSKPSSTVLVEAERRSA